MAEILTGPDRGPPRTDWRDTALRLERELDLARAELRFARELYSRETTGLQERVEDLEQYAERLEVAINNVLERANGETPSLVYVGKGFTLNALRHALLDALHDPQRPEGEGRE